MKPIIYPILGIKAHPETNSRGKVGNSQDFITHFKPIRLRNTQSCFLTHFWVFKTILDPFYWKIPNKISMKSQNWKLKIFPVYDHHTYIYTVPLKCKVATTLMTRALSTQEFCKTACNIRAFTHAIIT